MSFKIKLDVDEFNKQAKIEDPMYSKEKGLILSQMRDLENTYSLLFNELFKISLKQKQLRIALEQYEVEEYSSEFIMN